MVKDQSLTPFFRELLEKRWTEFVVLEADPDVHNSAQAVVVALIRACTRGKLPAIKEAIARVDGKVAEQIEIEYPKFYFVYPNATELSPSPAPEPQTSAVASAVARLDDTPADTEPITGSLRDILTRMAKEPKALVNSVLAAAGAIDDAIKREKMLPKFNDPLVKSVISAGLLKLAHNGSLGAIFEVFDNIDGKLVEKIRILGEDVYVTSYAEIAPAGSVKNKDGVYELCADNLTNRWAVSLGKKELNNGFNK